jgi:hypothetical protein
MNWGGQRNAEEGANSWGLLILSVIAVGCLKTVNSLATAEENPKGPVAIDANRFVLAGSGTNLPITEKLAAAYNAKIQLGACSASNLLKLCNSATNLPGKKGVLT